MNSGIYIVINKKNGKRYVGSSVKLRARLGQHRRDLQSETHHNRHLQRAWNKYGEDAFGFRVLFYCDPEMCITFEQRAMDVLEPEYNIEPIAGSSLGSKRGPLSDEHRAKVSAGLMGHETSEETKAKISTANMGRVFSEESLANMGSVAGWHHTKEAKAKISAASKEGYRLGKGLFGQTDEQWKDSQKKGGAACYKKGVGAFALSSEQLSECGKKCRDMGVGIHGLTSRQRKENYEKGLGRFATKQRVVWGKMARKLTPSQVHEIRHLLALGDMTQKEIARHYPVTYTTIGEIKSGRGYADW